MSAPLAIFGLDVGDLVEDAVRALVDLVVPDFGSQWVSSLVTWLVALPPVTGSAFPSLNHYADELTAVGYGLLGACFLGGLLQLWAGGSTGAAGAEAVRRAAIGAGALATYTTVLQSLLVGVNILTAEMIRHPLVVDGLDKAFGEALTVAAVTNGVSLGLAIAAAIVVLYFVAALFVLKIGLTALLAVAVVAGALVWGLYPLPQAHWLARAWVSGLVAALAVPVAWACVFAAAALLARDTLVFDGGGQFNQPLGETLGYLVKPFAAVACFWIAYRAPYFLLGIARTAGLSSAVFRRPAAAGGSAAGPAKGGGPPSVRSTADRFRAFFVKPPSRSAAGRGSGGRSVVRRTSGRAVAETASGRTPGGTQSVRSAPGGPSAAQPVATATSKRRAPTTAEPDRRQPAASVPATQASDKSGPRQRATADGRRSGAAQERPATKVSRKRRQTPRSAPATRTRSSPSPAPPQSKPAVSDRKGQTRPPSRPEPRRSPSSSRGEVAGRPVQPPKPAPRPSTRTDPPKRGGGRPA
ncbi:MAG TPA: hypothetical protein VF529_00085 [Solirubrobacteraceae bacterium]